MKTDETPKLVHHRSKLNKTSQLPKIQTSSRKNWRPLPVLLRRAQGISLAEGNPIALVAGHTPWTQWKVINGGSETETLEGFGCTSVRAAQKKFQEIHANGSFLQIRSPKPLKFSKSCIWKMFVWYPPI